MNFPLYKTKIIMRNFLGFVGFVCSVFALCLMLMSVLLGQMSFAIVAFILILIAFVILIIVGDPPF